VDRSGQDAEALAGRQAAALLEDSCGGVIRSVELESRMATLGALIARNSRLGGAEAWTFLLLGSSRPNAFSLPGNRIYLTRGLALRIGRDDDLLAAVLAHEMAHIACGDSLRPECASRQEALDREMNADSLASGYLAAAGRPADSLVRLLRVIRDVQPADWAAARIASAQPHT
jgi:predicted Zn-dependent protease